MSRTRKDGKRSPKDQYFTPQECIDPMVDRLIKRPWDTVIDVGSGDGRIIESLYSRYFERDLAGGMEWFAVEPYHKGKNGDLSGISYRSETFQDFVINFHSGEYWTVAGSGRTLIVSNPPYSELDKLFPLMTDIIEKSDPGSALVLLLRLDWLAGKKRTEQGVYETSLDMTNVFTLSPRPKFSNSKGCDSGDYAWIVWQKTHEPLGIFHESWLWKK